MLDVLNKADGLASTTVGGFVLIVGVLTLAIGKGADNGTDEAIDWSSMSAISPSVDSNVFALDDSPLMQQESQITESAVTSHPTELN
jgi:hypothetical protein